MTFLKKIILSKSQSGLLSSELNNIYFILSFHKFTSFLPISKPAVQKTGVQTENRRQNDQSEHDSNPNFWYNPFISSIIHVPQSGYPMMVRIIMVTRQVGIITSIYTVIWPMLLQVLPVQRIVTQLYQLVKIHIRWNFKCYVRIIIFNHFSLICTKNINYKIKQKI